MKVLLINPPSPFLINPLAFPPLSLLYLASALEADGHDAEVLDLNMGGPLGGRGPLDLIGITGLTPHVPILKDLIPVVRAAYPKVPIILGGPHFYYRSADAFTLGADAVCVGDGENAIIAALFGGRGTMHGFVDVNDWPPPARHLLDLHAYPYKINGLPATSIMTTRGCAYRCAYCVRGPGYSTVRHRALDLVAKEVDQIKALGFPALQVYNDEVNLSTRNLHGLCEMFKGAGITWRGFIRANLFTMEQAKAMADSGCVEACCGVESGSDGILKAVDKRATVADATKARAFAAQAGLRFKAFCMIGLPGETEETVQATKKWLLDMRPDDFDICPFTPYPGSDISDHPENYDIKIEHNYWEASYFHKGTPGQYNVCVSTKALSSQRIGELREQVEREVREALGLGGLL